MRQLSLDGLVSYDSRAELVESIRVLLRARDWAAIGNVRSRLRHDVSGTSVVNELCALTDDEREEYA